MSNVGQLHMTYTHEELEAHHSRRCLCTSGPDECSQKLLHVTFFVAFLCIFLCAHRKKTYFRI